MTKSSLPCHTTLTFDGNDLLLLVGAEPDHQWQTFVGDVTDLFVRFDVRLVVGLGAYPAAVPHTRPTRLASAHVGTTGRTQPG